MKAPRAADLVTLGNLCAGFLAILSEEVWIGAGFIMLGAVLDFLDGWVARWLKQASDLGVQLDSLADMVTFGVAPALLFYRMLPEDRGTLLVCLLIPAASAWRLARFNLLPPAPVFSGLPTPANALWYVGLTLWLPAGAERYPAWLTEPALHLGLSLALSAAMVSALPVPSFKSAALMRTFGAALLLSALSALAAWGAGWPELIVNAALAGLLLGLLLQVVIRRLQPPGK